MDKILWWGFYFLTFYAFLPGIFSRIFGFRVFSKGKTEKEVALTFDDGPDPVYTPKLLDLLKQHGAKATFFVVGSHAEKHPEVIKRMHDEGHIIGIHNYVHRSNWIMRPKTVKRQVHRTSDIVKSITGERPKYYRPPWGIVNIFDFANKGNLQIVLWTSMFGDWKQRVGADRLYRKMRRKLQPGQVLLLHDCGDTFGADHDAPANTIAALERLLNDGRELGLRFVGIDRMIETTERARAKRKAARSGAEEPADETSRTAEPHRQGPIKRAVVALWMQWERIFQWLFRLRAVGDGKAFHYRVVKYGGPELLLKNGEALRRGDYVMEIHFVNKMMYEFGMTSRSEMHTAIRVIQAVKHALPEMASELANAPHGSEIKALYGVTMINRGAEGLGFESFDLPRGMFSFLTNWYLRLLTVIIHPDGRTRVKKHGERMTPRALIMRREVLLSWGDKPADAPRPERRGQAAKAKAKRSVYEERLDFAEEEPVGDTV
ncbi:polysaccharide deacetylase family protein [Cohnella sp. REN36]|uniref:polysaccharide deacetylase family protein n=1 Tax=Cohnella sp. REN36 TaxID=2887347 RepID=UPI001D1417AD|nr:polysaccharide deacetylase family protein [Cohnella sp. REN36]MCC3375624.1 polysaccharide deacetylase family protein [Cohnella sp. REN36]